LHPNSKNYLGDKALYELYKLYKPRPVVLRGEAGFTNSSTTTQ